MGFVAAKDKTGDTMTVEEVRQLLHHVQPRGLQYLDVHRPGLDVHGRREGQLAHLGQVLPDALAGHMASEQQRWGRFIKSHPGSFVQSPP